ncbi:MAG: hypothetical protein ACI8R4_003373 [Paracoccaceae bacterium]|jgi:hypothetical protein
MSADQQTFNTALLDPSHPVPDGLHDGAARPAGRRFDVYRNNVAVSLTEAIRTGFPVITKLLGRENIDGLAGIFLRAHPPTSPVLIQYGQAFPDFLASTDQLAHLGYLADVARLELAIRRSYHAADAPPIAPDAFAALPPERLMDTTMHLAAAVQIIRSNWPIYDIWRFNTHEDAPKPSPVAQDVLITRPEFDPAPHLLPAGGAAWITALAKGQNIGAALETAATEDPDFDLAVPLALLLQGGAVTSLN